MGRPLERLKPIGFWSYARQDDEMSDGRLSRLRYQLAAELQLIYGRQAIKIFQDVAAIPPGADWEKAIDGAIGQATFFIPILTPAFIESEWCCEEVAKFLAREAAINAAHPELQGARRVFPIRYIDARNAEPFDPEVFAALAKIQATDFQSLRRESDQSPHVRDKLVTLADALAALLQIRVERPPTEDERAEERRQREADAEQRRRIDADRRAEEQRRREAAEADAVRQAEHDQIAREADEAKRRAAAEAAAERVARHGAAKDRGFTTLHRGWLGGVAAAIVVAAAVYLTNQHREDDYQHAAFTTAATTAATDKPVSAATGPAAETPPAGSTAPAPVAASPSWIAGTWAIAGETEHCSITIAISPDGTTLSFGRIGSDARVTTRFTFDPDRPDLLSTPLNHYTRLGPGSIEVTHGRTGKPVRLTSCVA